MGKPINKQNVLAIFTVSIFLSCILSCKSSGQKEVVAATDSTMIRLKSITLLKEAERDYYNRACERWYDSLLGRGNFNGSILVAKGGNIIFEKYKGSGHLGSADSIRSSTAFHIASVSKTITAMAVLKLAQEGKLNINDEFSKYFTEFNYPGVTIKTLLNHRSGLPNYLYFMEDLGWNKSEYVTNPDVLNYLVNRKAEIKNISRPDTRFTYCNTNYILLALLIEKISGTTFPLFIQNEFFKPLKMTNSFVFTLVDSARVNPSYDYRGQLIPMNFLDLAYGDKNIYSTAEDLLTWDRALDTNIIFNAATLQEAYTPYSNERPGIRNYGLGWRMNLYPNGKKMVYHNGWWHGYNAAFIRLLEEDVTIIVMGNRYTRDVYKAKDLALLFGSQYTGGDDEGESPRTADTAAIPNQRKMTK